MTEGIEYDPLGTVDVTFDEMTYHLGRPKFRQFRYFTNKLEEQRQDLTDALQRVQREVEEAEKRYADDEDSPEAKEELERLRDEFGEISRTRFYEKTVGILAEMFDQIGDPLPGKPENGNYDEWDIDDWPAWLAADSSIPGKILTHWRNAPKASGSNGKNE